MQQNQQYLQIKKIHAAIIGVIVLAIIIFFVYWQWQKSEQNVISEPTELEIKSIIQTEINQLQQQIPSQLTAMLVGLVPSKENILSSTNIDTIPLVELFGEKAVSLLQNAANAAVTNLTEQGKQQLQNLTNNPELLEFLTDKQWLQVNKANIIKCVKLTDNSFETAYDCKVELTLKSAPLAVSWKTTNHWTFLLPSQKIKNGISIAELAPKDLDISLSLKEILSTFFD